MRAASVPDCVRAVSLPDGSHPPQRLVSKSSESNARFPRCGGMLRGLTAHGLEGFTPNARFATTGTYVHVASNRDVMLLLFYVRAKLTKPEHTQKRHNGRKELTP
jgi:hypothetical protein